MPWLQDNNDTNTQTTTTDDRWLKFGEIRKVGETDEIKMRILEEEPIGAWRHWFENRPYNCVGFQFCPVCKVRMEAKVADPDNYKDKYKMDFRYFFNVLVNGEVKIYSFGNGVGKQLKTFAGKYGDLRDYDVTILKRKIGNLTQNVEYTVLYEGKRELTPEEEGARDNNRYDLTEYIKPGKTEDLAAVARGQVPSAEPQGTEVSSDRATRADMMVFKALAESKGLDPKDFGIDNTKPPKKSVLDSLIADLKNEE